ncbi:MAG: metal ABC transporter permease [Sulfuricella sp.]
MRGLCRYRQRGPVTASVQLVGVYLVFASLIVPALACRYYPPRMRMAAGYAVGAAGYILGLGLSVLFDLPSGAVVVWTLALVGITAYSLGAGWSRSIAK